MKKIFVLLLFTNVAFADPYLPDQEKYKAIWPKEVEFKGKFYKATEYSQRIAITNERPSNVLRHINQDDVWTNGFAANPNKSFPYKVSGGMDEAKNWTSTPLIYLPSRPIVRDERINVFQGGLLPAKQWSFPDGTIVADMLHKDGVCFELRVRAKNNGKWVSSVLYKNEGARPLGYKKLSKTCVECHKKAGASEQYGITVRGCDTVFSWSPFD